MFPWWNFLATADTPSASTRPESVLRLLGQAKKCCNGRFLQLWLWTAGMPEHGQMFSLASSVSEPLDSAETVQSFEPRRPRSLPIIGSEWPWAAATLA